MPFGISAGTAALIGTGVSAAAGIAGGIMQSNAIGRASDKSNALQREGQQHAIDALEQGRTDAVGALRGGQTDTIAAQRAALAQARTDLEPWRSSGGNALTVASNLSGANGPEAAAAAREDFFTSPGYQFRLDEGLRGVDAGAAARGMLRSGATLKEEQRFGEGLASEEFGNYYNRLYQLSGLGANAAAATGGYEMQTGQNLGNAYLNTAGRLGDTYTGSAGKIAGAYMGTAQDVARTEGARGATDAGIYGNTTAALGTSISGLASNPQFMNSIFPTGTGVSAWGTPGISASGNPVMTGYAPPTYATPAAGGGYTWGAR
jgi:hypothetical protein